MSRQLRAVPLTFLFVLAGSLGRAQEAPQSAGWISLFDGRTMDHWNDPRKSTPPGDAWTIEDGSLHALPHPNIEEDLVSTEAYGDFELVWEWKLAPGANSGLKYRIQAQPVIVRDRAQPAPTRFEDSIEAAVKQGLFSRSIIPAGSKAQIYVVGLEYQMIDNARHPDARRGPLYQSAALYGVQPASVDATRPIGSWNQSRLLVNGSHVEHWLNGKKIVDVALTPEFLLPIMTKRWGKGTEMARLLSEQPHTQCPISLQNHDDPAWFRNLRIRRLP